MAFLLHSSEFAPPGIGAQQVGESLTHHSRQRLDWCFMIADRSQASHESTEILVPFSDPRSIFRTPRTTWRRSVHPFVTQRMCPASADLSRPSSASGVHLKPEIIVRRVLGNDANGNVFIQVAIASKISGDGAVLSSMDERFRCGDLIWILIAERKHGSELSG
jgi:hypothetical protein